MKSIEYLNIKRVITLLVLGFSIAFSLACGGGGGISSNPPTGSEQFTDAFEVSSTPVTEVVTNTSTTPQLKTGELTVEVDLSKLTKRSKPLGSYADVIAVNARVFSPSSDFDTSSSLTRESELVYTGTVPGIPLNENMTMEIVAKNNLEEVIFSGNSSVYLTQSGVTPVPITLYPVEDGSDPNKPPAILSIGGQDGVTTNETVVLSATFRDNDDLASVLVTHWSADGGSFSSTGTTSSSNSNLNSYTDSVSWKAPSVAGDSIIRVQVDDDETSTAYSFRVSVSQGDSTGTGEVEPEIEVAPVISGFVAEWLENTITITPQVEYDSMKALIYSWEKVVDSSVLGSDNILSLTPSGNTFDYDVELKVSYEGSGTGGNAVYFLSEQVSPFLFEIESSEVVTINPYGFIVLNNNELWSWNWEENSPTAGSGIDKTAYKKGEAKQVLLTGTKIMSVSSNGKNTSIVTSSGNLYVCGEAGGTASLNAEDSFVEASKTNVLFLGSDVLSQNLMSNVIFSSSGTEECLFAITSDNKMYFAGAHAITGNYDFLSVPPLTRSSSALSFSPIEALLLPDSTGNRMIPIKQFETKKRSAVILNKDGLMWLAGAKTNSRNLGVNEYNTNFEQIVSENVEKFSNGDDGYVLFTKKDTSLWGTGSNYYGQLGLSINTDYYEIPQKIIDGDVLDVSASTSHALFLKKDGTIYGMGRTLYLGINTTEYYDEIVNENETRAGREGTLTPVKLSNESYVGIAAGKPNHAITRSGNIIAFGYFPNGSQASINDKIEVSFGANK